MADRRLGGQVVGGGDGAARPGGHGLPGALSGALVRAGGEGGAGQGHRH